MSNSRRSIHSSLPQADVSPKIAIINRDLDKMKVERALGILWNPVINRFQIKHSLKSVLATKRAVLSLFSSIFDQLSFITPKPKFSNFGENNLLAHTITIKSDTTLGNLVTLPLIQIIALDKWYGFQNNDIDLHLFADASKVDYNVVYFFRSKTINEINYSFVKSKSRLSPVN